MKRLIVILLTFLINVSVDAQRTRKKTPEVDISNFERYSQTHFSIGSGGYFGNVSGLSNFGIGIDASYSQASNNRYWGYNFKGFVSNTRVDDGFNGAPARPITRINPVAMDAGIHYGISHGKHYNSHYFTTIGANYKIFLINKLNGELKSFGTVAPFVTVGKSMKRKKNHFQESESRYLNYKPEYDPHVRSGFIDLFITYQYMPYSNDEIRGHHIVLGARLKFNKYRVKENLKVNTSTK